MRQPMVYIGFGASSCCVLLLLLLFRVIISFALHVVGSSCAFRLIQNQNYVSYSCCGHTLARYVSDFVVYCCVKCWSIYLWLLHVHVLFQTQTHVTHCWLFLILIMSCDGIEYTTIHLSYCFIDIQLPPQLWTVTHELFSFKSYFAFLPIVVVLICEQFFVLFVDDLAEWLRRLPAKQVRFACVGSNPTVVEQPRVFLRKFWCLCGSTHFVQTVVQSLVIYIYSSSVVDCFLFCVHEKKKSTWKKNQTKRTIVQPPTTTTCSDHTHTLYSMNTKFFCIFWHICII